MKDSLPETIKSQLEIMMSKSESERFRIGDEFNKFGRKILENSIRQEHPGIPDTDVKIEVFKRCYSSYFSPDELQRILLSMREYWSEQLFFQRETQE
jgi:hypothetical protein